MWFTVSMLLHVQACPLRASAIARVSDSWFDPLSGNIGRGGKIVRTVFDRRRGSSPADSQTDDHSDTDQDQGHRTFDQKSRSILHGRADGLMGRRLDEICPRKPFIRLVKDKK